MNIGLREFQAFGPGGGCGLGYSDGDRSRGAAATAPPWTRRLLQISHGSAVVAKSFENFRVKF